MCEGCVALFPSVPASSTGQTVALRCDSVKVVASDNKQGGTASRGLCMLTKQFLSSTETHSMTLRAKVLPGRAMVLADQLSRRIG